MYEQKHDSEASTGGQKFFTFLFGRGNRFSLRKKIAGPPCGSKISYEWGFRIYGVQAENPEMFLIKRGFLFDRVSYKWGQWFATYDNSEEKIDSAMD